MINFIVISALFCNRLLEICDIMLESLLFFRRPHL